MKMINCIVADDEELARGILESYINRAQNLKLVATCSNGTEVYHALKNNTVDLLFLDIQMPQLTGIELLKTVKNPPPVIITTAYREFALESYELNVIDYLLKPIGFDRFLKAVDKYETLTSPGNIPALSIPSISEDNHHGFIYVKSDKKMVRILLKEILFIEGLKDYVKIQLTNRSVITYQTLTYFEETFSADHFIRVHRSYIISLDHISTYSANQIEIGAYHLPIGSTYAKAVQKRLET